MRLLVLAFLLIVVLPKAAYAQCVNPAGAEGDVIYNSSHNVPQYCDGSDNWIAMVGAAPEPTGPQNCQSIGDTCDDGSIYAGLSPDGNVAMYTTPADAASTYTWNDGTANFTDMSMANCTDASPGTAATCQTGEANTAYLVGATGEPDYPFAAAEYCDGLSAHGHDDWYLPAQDELNVLYTNKNTGDLNGTFDETGSFPAGYYWSSSELIATNARYQSFSDGGQSNSLKVNGLSVRCVRRHEAGEGRSQSTQIVPDGLIGHWRLDETSGTTVADSSGNGNDATVQGTTADAATTDGVVSRGFTADGTSAGVNLGPLTLQGGNHAMSFWFYIDSIGGRIFSRDNSHFMQISDGDNDGIFTFDLRLRNHITNTGPGTFHSSWTEVFHVGRWHHFAISSNPTNTVLYLDGNLLNTIGLSNTLEVNDLRFGLHAEPFLGKWDDIRIYNRPLSAVEVREIYQARDGVRYNESHRTPEFFDGNKWVAMPTPFPDVQEGLIGHWKLDETDGTVIKDYSDNGNDGFVDNGLDTEQDSVRGAVGMALDVNGGNKRVTVLHDASLTPASGDLSVSFWIKPAVDWDDLPNDIWHLIGKTNENNAGNFNEVAGWRINVSGYHGQSFTFRLNNGTGGTRFFGGSPVWEIGKWYHIVVTFDLDSFVATFYFDGTVNNVDDNRTPIPMTDWGASNLWIGDARFNGDLEGVIDDLRIYDRVLSAYEVQKLYKMGTPEGSSTALPQGCPSIGDVCDDGTIYAGLSPDGSVEMYTTPADAPSTYTWNDGTINWSDMTMVNCTDASPGTAASCQTGEANTAFLVGASGETDYPFAAAEYCAGLSEHGSDDWYLPAQDELNVLYTNKNTSALNGTFDETGSFGAGHYWSSSESDIDWARYQIFSDGGQYSDLKDNGFAVRCVRKGPAPRCANPYGREGDMFYNTTHDVVQYCDSARWVAIGKASP